MYMRSLGKLVRSGLNEKSFWMLLGSNPLSDRSQMAHHCTTASSKSCNYTNRKRSEQVARRSPIEVKLLVCPTRNIAWDKIIKVINIKTWTNGSCSNFHCFFNIPSNCLDVELHRYIIATIKSVTWLWIWRLPHSWVYFITYSKEIQRNHVSKRLTRILSEWWKMFHRWKRSKCLPKPGSLRLWKITLVPLDSFSFITSQEPVDAMHGKRMQIKCSIDDIRYLELKVLACQKVYNRDRSIRFQNYVMGFCTQLQKREKKTRNELLEDKIQQPRFNWLYKHSKSYRLVKILQEATRLLALHHGLILKGVDCERKHQYRTIVSLRAVWLALRYRIQYYGDFWLMECWKCSVTATIQHWISNAHHSWLFRDMICLYHKNYPLVDIDSFLKI